MNSQTVSWRGLPVEFKVLTVRKLAAERLSAAQIAKRLSERYGKVTRGAVIGLCHRNGIELSNSNGWKADTKPKRRTAARHEKQNPAPDGKVIAFPPSVQVQAPEPLPPQVPDPVPASSHEPGPEGISIHDLTSETCKQPLWGFADCPVNGGRYCGREVASGAYCSLHALRNYVPYEERKKGVRK